MNDWISRLNIRSIIAAALVLMVQLVWASEAAAQTRRLEWGIEIVQVRENMHMLVMEPAGNVLVAIGEEGVLLIDDQFRPMTGRDSIIS